MFESTSRMKQFVLKGGMLAEQSKQRAFVGYIRARAVCSCYVTFVRGCHTERDQTPQTISARSDPIGHASQVHSMEVRIDLREHQAISWTPKHLPLLRRVADAQGIGEVRGRLCA